MMTQYELILPEGFDERREEEMQLRGYLSQVVVQLETGRKYALFFVDPVRLESELDDVVRMGDSCMAEVGMVILPEVTMKNIRAAIDSLVTRKYFDYFRALQEGDRPWE